MGNRSATDWSGTDFLAQVGGTSVEYPPARVFFLVHRNRASGRLWLTQNADIRTVDLVDGAIVDCTGFPGLLSSLDIEGDRSQGIGDLVARAVAAGHDEAQALEEAVVSLCAAVLAMEDGDPWMVQFAVDAASPANPVSLPIHVVKAIHVALMRTVSEASEQAWIETHGAKSMTIQRPDDSSPESWGLDAQTLALIDACDQTDFMGDLLDRVGESGWAGFGMLRRLGLIAPSALSQGQEIRGESPVSDASQRSRFDRPRAAHTPQERPKRKKKRAPVDAIAITLQCAPWERPKEEIDQLLRDVYTVLTEQTPDVIFGMSSIKDLDTEWTERRFHAACARYHPDRYLDCPQAVQSLAEGCFTAVSAAFHALAEPEVVEKIRSRLIEKETGKKPVTDKTRQRARLHFAKAELLFRQRQYEEAHKLLLRAVEGDPERWNYSYLLVQTAWRAGKIPLTEAVETITGMDGLTAQEQGDALCLGGEMLMSDNREREAFRLFKEAVRVDENNVGAQRRLRLRERRVEAAKREEREAKGFLGGLFQRRKD